LAKKKNSRGKWLSCVLAVLSALAILATYDRGGKKRGTLYQFCVPCQNQENHWLMEEEVTAYIKELAKERSCAVAGGNIHSKSQFETFTYALWATSQTDVMKIAQAVEEKFHVKSCSYNRAERVCS